MECLQQALKNSSEETVAKPTAALSDDFWTTGLTVDDFFVDNLLDFSEDQHNDEDIQQDETVMLQHEPAVEPEVKVEGSVVAGSDLCFPPDDVADLEWLSNFVDDSAAGYSLTVPAGTLSAKPDVKCPEPEITASPNTIFSTFQTKARSKRTRTGVRVWSLGSNSLTDSSSSSSSSSSLTTSFPSPSNPWAFYELAQSSESLFGKPPAKKKQVTEAQPRRCSHCHVQKTPQWRTGPHGAKTLCNACGVRFKSGRLLPEYRPACSPTFSSEIHSNNHRKVMEMRRKKEGEDGFEVPV